MRVLLFGYPLAHSLSPKFQNAAFRSCGLDIRYELFPRERFDRLEARHLLLSDDVVGANVTVPHKEAAVTAVDRLTRSALLVGAVNTLFCEATDEGGLRIVGDNTDLGGFDADLCDRGLDGPLEAAVVIGAGGASRAVLPELARRAERIALVNRTPERALRVVAELRARLDVAATISVHAFPARPDGDGALNETFSRADLVVDTTPLGLGLSPDDAAFTECKAVLMQLPLGRSKATALFYDLKYGAVSPFLAVATEIGARTTDGLGMLLHQGALSFERWTGRPAPIDVMRSALT